jgi:dimethylamine/trimethylamine dehydrogenase
MPNVTLYLGNRLLAADVREFGADHVLIATGASWRRDGIGRWHARALATLAAGAVYTPDDIMDGRRPAGEILLFDDDHYYMGPVIAQLLAASGARVRYVTTEGRAGAWSLYTQEQERAQRALIEHGVAIEVNVALDAFDGTTATIGCIFTGRQRQCAATAVVLVTARLPDEALYRELCGEDDEAVTTPGAGAGAGHASVLRIGDCVQPALIANAVYSGHRAARELGGAAAVPRRDRVLVKSDSC